MGAACMNDRQMGRRQNTCEILFVGQKKSFFHRIITGDEKWIYFENPKLKKSWVYPAQPSTSSARPNRFGRKTMICVWWDQQGIVYYERLKPGETINVNRYHQQLIKLHRALCEKDRIINKDMTSWFFSTTTHQHTHLQWSKTTWRHSTGRCYPMPLIHQTWSLPTTTCFCR